MYFTLGRCFNEIFMFSIPEMLRGGTMTFLQIFVYAFVVFQTPIYLWLKYCAALLYWTLCTFIWSVFFPSSCTSSGLNLCWQPVWVPLIPSVHPPSEGVWWYWRLPGRGGWEDMWWAKWMDGCCVVIHVCFQWYSIKHKHDLPYCHSTCMPTAFFASLSHVCSSLTNA